VRNYSLVSGKKSGNTRRYVRKNTIALQTKGANPQTGAVNSCTAAPCGIYYWIDPLGIPGVVFGLNRKIQGDRNEFCREIR
jgi:hypothetical protein